MINSLYEPFRKWSERGTIFLYSDTHFGRKDMPPDCGWISEEEQIKLINQKVGKYDTLIILGDVGDISYVPKLRGYKVLIMGNHDSGASNYKELFDEVYEGPLFISERILLSHEPIDLPFAYNIHGHVHCGKPFGERSMNVAADVINFVPVNFNQFLKSGRMKDIPNINKLATQDAVKKKISN